MSLPLRPSAKPNIAHISITACSPLSRLNLPETDPEDHDAILDAHNAGRHDLIMNVRADNVDVNLHMPAHVVPDHERVNATLSGLRHFLTPIFNQWGIANRGSN